MESSWTCMNCGCTDFRLNSTSTKVVCRGCGREAITVDYKNSDYCYLKKVAEAGKHLQVGNWKEAKRTLTTLSSTHPNDTQLYLLLFKAVTKDFSDCLIDDDDGREEACELWDKLTRLKASNGEMERYRRLRIRRVDQERKLFLLKSVMSILIGFLALLVNYVIFALGHIIWGIAFAFLTITIWLVVFDCIGEGHHRIGKNKITGRGKNPFI